MRQPRPLQLAALFHRSPRSRRTRSANAGATFRGAAGAALPDAGMVPPDAGRIAAEIGTAALELAKQANRAGLTTLGYLLENAALEAGAEAASFAGSLGFPGDAAEP